MHGGTDGRDHIHIEKMSAEKKIVFMGTPEFAVPALAALHEGGFTVAAVITAPDKPAGRGQSLRQSAVKAYALSLGILVLQPTNLKDESFISALRAFEADLFVVVAFRMLPEVVWTMPPLGTFNLHASLLPAYRGAAPINHAIINGEKETGVTTFFLKHEIDTGDIIESVSVPIAPNESAGQLHDRLMETGAALVKKTAGRILKGSIQTIPQQKSSDKHAPKLTRENCRIDWRNNAVEIHNLVRGLSPYPAAWTTLALSGGKTMQCKIFSTNTSATHSLEPGYISVEDKSNLFVGTGTNAIQILEMQLEGRKRMAVRELLRGLTLEPGVIFK